MDIELLEEEYTEILKLIETGKRPEAIKIIAFYGEQLSKSQFKSIHDFEGFINSSLDMSPNFLSTFANFCMLIEIVIDASNKGFIKFRID